MQRSTLEQAAAKYTYLRGLYYLPLGLLLVLSALGNWQVGPFRHDWAFLTAAAGVVLACLPVNRWYEEHYGRLSPSAAQQVRGGLAVLAAVTVMVVGSMLLRSGVPWSLDLPVNAPAVTFALVMLISYGVGVGLKRHHVVIWGALLVTGALPVWTGADPSNLGMLLAGVAVMVCGIFDHRLFVRTFGSPRAAAADAHVER